MFFSGIQLEAGLHMRWLKRLCAEAKVTPFGAHGIRALAGTLAHTNGACLMDVKELLRHKSTHQTDKYLRKQYRQNEAVNILSSITSKTGNNGKKDEDRNNERQPKNKKFLNLHRRLTPCRQYNKKKLLHFRVRA